ncbi:mesocentin-like [Penaeus chinensis]|uniref:mesocentin-like n=1 Tax=Penaeus chinensis TaxID=139456 RepID=UPI001FB802E4|nr:mesocentin-like [Penaeus chinensis]
MMNARLILAAAAVCVARATPLPYYEYSCIHYCESLYGPEVSPYCCRMAKVFQGEDSNNIEHRPTKEEILNIGECPPIRSFCPRAGQYAVPLVCSNDGVCASSDKCCYDACLETKICKTAVKRYRRSLPDQSENDDLGAAKVSSVILTEDRNPVSVVVDGSGNPVTLVEGDAVTIVATGPVNLANSQNITHLPGADKAASSDSVSSKKIKRAVIAESDRVSSNVLLSPDDSVSIVKDRYGSVIINDNKPLILVQKEKGPTIILNDNGLRVLAGHDTSKGAVLGVVTPTTVPYLEVQSHHPPSSAPDRDPIRLLVKGDGNPVTLVDGDGPLQVQNADGVSFVADVPEVRATDMPGEYALPMAVTSQNTKINHIIVDSAGNPTKIEDGSGVLVVSKTAETSNEASSEENSSYSRRRRRSRSSANAVVDGNDITVTLVDASHVDVDIVDIAGNKINVVAGDHILNIGESTLATVEFVEGRPVVRDENGRILLDKMGSPLTVKPASDTQPLPTVYSIVDGKYKPINLVASDNTPVHVYDSNGNELAINGGGSDMEVSRETVSIMKRASGEDLLLQNGEALADEDGMLLKATSVNTRHYSEVSTNVLVDGDGNTVNLLSINGSPTTVIDDSDNVVTVKTGNKIIMLEDINVTTLLENGMMVLKKPSGELVVDENGLPVTLVPEHRSRRRRSIASEGHGIMDSHENTVTLTDVHGVPVTLDDGKGNIVKPVAGEIIMETGTAAAFIVETNEGKRLIDENGNFIVDSEGNALLFVSKREIVSSQETNVIVDGTNNTVQLLSVRGSPITIVDRQGNDVDVKDGDVQIVKNTESAMIIDMVDDTVLVDSSGSIMTDLNGKNLRIMTARKKAQKVAVNVLVNGEGNTVTLSTLEGTPVTLLDNEEVVVTMAGEVQLAVDGTNTARVRRSSSEVNVVDETDFLLADDKGKLLTMKRVGEHKETSVATNILVDEEGNSLTLIDLNDSPITVVDDSGNNIALASGERTLKVEMTGHLQVMETTDRYARSLESDGAKTKRKLLVDDAGNPVHSENGPIQVVPTNNEDLAPEAENFLEVTEEFVEASFSLQRLSAVVKHEQHLLKLNLVRESSITKSRDYESFVEEINVFVDVVGKLQAKCLKKMMQILEKEPGSHEKEAYALLEEVNEMLTNNIP